MLPQAAFVLDVARHISDGENLERPRRAVLDFQISRFLCLAVSCGDRLTECEFCDFPFLLFKFEASPRRNFLSKFSILFPGPCPAGCPFSLVVTNFSPFSFCLMLLPHSRMSVLASRGFVGACVCVCVWRVLPGSPHLSGGSHRASPLFVLFETPSIPVQ